MNENSVSRRSRVSHRIIAFLSAFLVLSRDLKSQWNLYFQYRWTARRISFWSYARWIHSTSMIRERIHHFEVFPTFCLSWIIQIYPDYLDLPIHIRNPQLRSKDIFCESYPLQSNLFGIHCYYHEWLLPRICTVVYWYSPSGLLDSVRKYFDIEPGLNIQCWVKSHCNLKSNLFHAQILAGAFLDD